MMTEVPEDFRNGDIELRYQKIVPGDSAKGLVPFYHFKIVRSDGSVVGHINFRVGDTPHVNLTAGHIGFEILPEFRGNSYAYKACQALKPFVRRQYERVILTAAPENIHSIRIIEKLGAKFIDEVEVPTDDPAYLQGARKKVRYEWAL
jgi:predicted acetyltransferase